MLPLLTTAVRQILFSDKTKKLVDISGEKGLVYNAAGGALTNGRSSTATVVDFEGLVRNCKAGEIRYSGARRVENLLSLLNTEDNTHAGYSKFNCTATTATLVTFSSSNGEIYINTSYDIELGSSPNGRNFRFTVELTSGTASACYIGMADAGSWAEGRALQSGVLPLTSTPTRFSIIYSPTTAVGNAITCAVGLSANQGQSSGNQPIGTINITKWMVEEITGQTNQNPSEYVSSEVVHNSGAARVKYFGYQNGNTVASNVVIEGVGAAIDGISMLHEGSATNLITNNSGTGASGMTLPTDWVTEQGWGSAIGPSEGIIVNYNGYPRYKFRINGITVSANKFLLSPSSNFITITQNTVYTIRGAINCLVGTPNSAYWNIELKWYDSSNVYISSYDTYSTPIAYSNNLSSFTATSPANAVKVKISLIFENGYSAASNVDLTFGIFGLQFESGNYATSYIPTTTAAVTRAIDSIQLPLVKDINFTPKSGIALFKFTPKYKQTDGGNKAFVVLTNNDYGFIYDESNVGNKHLGTYDGSSSTLVFSDYQKNITILIALIYNKKENKISISFSTDNGVTWTNSNINNFSGDFITTANKFLYFNGLSLSAEMKFFKFYKTNKSFSAMQRWIKSRAVAEV